MVFEQIIYIKMNSYIEGKLSKYIAGFRKAQGIQHSLIAMLENRENVLNKGESVRCLFLDLSKAFDTIIAIVCCQN